MSQNTDHHSKRKPPGASMAGDPKKNPISSVKQTGNCSVTPGGVHHARKGTLLWFYISLIRRKDEKNE